MSRLTDIPIRIELESPLRTGGLGGGVAAVLSELVGMLEVVAQGGPSATIDLRSLPMSPHDRIELKRTLGDGEVQANLDAGGRSTLRETHISGVWWVEYRDQQGETIAELLEVTQVPRILASALDEIAASAEELRAQISLQSSQGIDRATRQ